MKSYIYSDPSYMEVLIDIEDYTGELIELNLIQDKIKSFAVPTPELSFAELTNKYGGQILKVEGTFYEHSDDVIIYTAVETDESYIITGKVDVTELETGDYIQLYDVYGDFDSIVDIIIVIEK